MEKISTCSTVNDKETTKFLWRIWDEHPKYQLPGTNNWLIGYSWAALRTNFIVGRIMLDAGLSTNITVDHIFLTHGHSDHSASLYFNLFTPNKKIYVPNRIKSQVERFLICHFEISVPDHLFDPVEAGYEVIGCNPGDQYDIVNNGRKYHVRVYDNDHSVPCHSYGFEEEGKSLKDEYRGLSGKELGNLRRNGVMIENYIWMPRYIYIGDTTERVFDMNPDIFRYEVIIIECTFLFPDDLEQASITKHCHWQNLRPIIASHPRNTFILYHFSTRYKEAEIVQFFLDNAGDLDNIHPWTHS